MTFYELLVVLNRRLNTANFTGMQFKINTEPEWRETLSLRCNRLTLDQVSDVVSVCMELAKEFSATLERIAINKCYRLQETTGKKTFIPDRRTIYITIRPPKQEFDYLQEAIKKDLGDSSKFYYEIEPLLKIMEARR